MPLVHFFKINLPLPKSQVMDPNPACANHSTWDANAKYGSDRLQKALCVRVHTCVHLEEQMHTYEFLFFSYL